MKTDYADNFNSGNDENDSKDSRSDDKGVEPEAITIAEIGGRPYAFIGFERMGGVIVYEISDPYHPVFVTYTNNRNFDVDAETPEAGDLGVENIVIINAADSPNGQDLMVTANEVSGTVSIFSIDDSNTFGGNQPSFSMSNPSNNSPSTSAYPNPFKNEFELSFYGEGEEVTVNLYDQFGRLVMTVFQGDSNEGQNTLPVNLSESRLTPGIYMISIFSANKATQTISVLKE
jgi:choice-of-anchor I-like protein/type IX secretion system substrate protein